ncbi:hypothetical protein EGJ86_19335 [Pseudomonas sp. o96-267]|uniref:hypothetical protein n=1 Tax=Pseudomonas sp. o96-267 TaxID=2479853 RepID=UPI000F7AF3C7|nr:MULTISPECIES: hypothetical protein [Pseudomonas]MDH0959078.1 hypothetical protein [Pseudomonas chengduensis]MDV5863614.1 hypothetical protein [Pseudomonas mendocina]RRV31726.1 hypothetical protein EGJ86_19335 [Pseudomonas sp. o96-267]
MTFETTAETALNSADLVVIEGYSLDEPIEQIRIQGDKYLRLSLDDLEWLICADQPVSICAGQAMMAFYDNQDLTQPARSGAVELHVRRPLAQADLIPRG